MHSCNEMSRCNRWKHRRAEKCIFLKVTGVRLCVCVPVCVCVCWCFQGEMDFALVPLVSSPPSPSIALPLSLYYSHSALEGRQRTLNTLRRLLHCLCCFSVPVLHAHPIFVFINHNGPPLWVSWWLFLVVFCTVAPLLSLAVTFSGCFFFFFASMLVQRVCAAENCVRAQRQRLRLEGAEGCSKFLFLHGDASWFPGFALI